MLRYLLTFLNIFEGKTLGKISELNCPVAICNSLFVALYKSVASSSLTICPHELTYFLPYAQSKGWNKFLWK